MTSEEFENILLNKGFVIDDSWKSNTSGYNKPVYRYTYDTNDEVIIYSLGGYWWIQYRNGLANKNKSFETAGALLKFIEE